MTGDPTHPNSGRPGMESFPDDPSGWRMLARQPVPSDRLGPNLPPMDGSLGAVVAQGYTLRIDGTNVVRVPFGVRQPRRSRPARPDHWATLVLPFQPGSSPTPPPRAA